MSARQETVERVDWRVPERRREVLLDFWEFHLRYGAHPGVVYMLFPYLREELGWDREDALWFAFLNGNTQNPITSLLLFEASRGGVTAMLSFYEENYSRLAFDTDRRYHKKSFPAAVDGYLRIVEAAGQAAFWDKAAQGGFQDVWSWARLIPTFGRLSAFSYCEYLRIMDVDVDCDDLMLEDIQGSRSHRNGLCLVLGLDHLDWHSSNPAFDGRYSRDTMTALNLEAGSLLADMRARAAGQPWERDVSFFTLESTLCTYKGWHRVNRRYPNVYNDMLYDRIRAAERAWPERRFNLFWDARAALLPEHLRLEDMPCDPGLCPEKQNWYRLTGEPIMMSREYPKYANGFEEAVANCGFGSR